MTSQEEWRQIAYERSVGEQGNNSMGTMANQQGYETYLAKQQAQQQFYSDIQSSSPNTSTTYVSHSSLPKIPTTRSSTYVRSSSYLDSSRSNFYSRSSISSSSDWFPFVDDIVATIPRWVYWALAFLGAVAGYGYVSYSMGELIFESSEVFFSAYAWPVAIGFIAGGLSLPLLALMVKLFLSAIILGLIAGAFYLAFIIYQNWPL